MNFHGVLCWATITVVLSADCTSDAQAPADGCTCGLKEADGTVLTCASTKWCDKSVSGFGVCSGSNLTLAACKDTADDTTPIANSETKVVSDTAAVACNCGADNKIALAGETCALNGDGTVGTVTRPCQDLDKDAPVTTFGCNCGTTAKCVHGNAFCLATANSNAGQCFEPCTVTNGSAKPTAECVIDVATDIFCATTKYCDANAKTFLWDAPPYQVCPQKNGSTSALTEMCSCGNDKVAKPTEFCIVNADGTGNITTTTAKTACPKTNGLAVSAQDSDVPCACGTDFTVDDKAKGCDAAADSGKGKVLAGTTGDAALKLVCTVTDGKATSTTYPCACGTKETCETGADKKAYCKADGTCAAASSLPDCAVASATNGSELATAECLCGNTTAICGTDDYCDVSAAADTDAKKCSDTKSTTAACTTEAVGDTACLCGKTATCSTAGEFCHDSTGAGLCGKKCAVDPWNAIAANEACVCPGTSAVCPVAGYCIEKTAAAGDAAAVNICIGADEGTIYTALKTAAEAAATTKATAAEKARCNEASATTCEDGDFCTDKSGAECVGQFVATMGAAMYSL